MAIDGETGKIKWTYAPEVDFSQSTGVGGYGISVNRGIAHEDGKLFVLTFDDKLQAISAKTGEKIWSSEVADPATGAYESMAPTAYDGKVYVGVSGSEDGVRGFARRLRPEDRQEALAVLHRAQAGRRLGPERRRWRRRSTCRRRSTPRPTRSTSAPATRRR